MENCNSLTSIKVTTFSFRLLLLFVVWSVAGPRSYAIPTPWPCNGSGYLFQSNAANTTIYQVNLVTGTSTPYCTINGLIINGVGYDAAGGFFYGKNGTTLYKIGSNCEYTTTNIPTTIMPSGAPPAADVYNNIYYAIYSGSNVLYRYNLTTGTATSVTISPWPTPVYFLSDLAVNPANGLIYAVTQSPFRLLAINRNTGAVVSNTVLSGAGIASETGSFGACYFDAAGNLYIGNNNSGKIFRIAQAQNVNMNGGNETPVVYTQVTLFSNGPAASNNDGARCILSSINLDFGDAPNSYGTLLSSNGPRHEYGVTLGLGNATLTDNEIDGLPAAGATGDNNDGTNDEDLNVASQLLCISDGGSTRTWNLNVTNTTGGIATLYMWIDWDMNGTFDASELTTAAVPNNATNVSLTFNVPTGISASTLYSRFRITTGSIADGPLGAAPDGEVEDHLLTVQDCSTLPIGFVSFNARAIRNDAILDWAVAGTEASARFDIELSVNGSDFTEMATVTGTNIQGMARFTYTDKNAAGKGRKIYYRIKETEADGKHSYTNIQSVTFDKDPEGTISPNPVKRGSKVTISGKHIEKVLLYNAVGKQVASYTPPQSEKVTVETSGLTEGQYFLLINGISVYRLVVTH